MGLLVSTVASSAFLKRMVPLVLSVGVPPSPVFSMIWTVAAISGSFWVGPTDCDAPLLAAGEAVHQVFECGAAGCNPRRAFDYGVRAAGGDAAAQFVRPVGGVDHDQVAPAGHASDLPALVEFLPAAAVDDGAGA